MTMTTLAPSTTTNRMVELRADIAHRLSQLGKRLRKTLGAKHQLFSPLAVMQLDLDELQTRRDTLVLLQGAQTRRDHAFSCQFNGSLREELVLPLTQAIKACDKAVLTKAIRGYDQAIDAINSAHELRRHQLAEIARMRQDSKFARFAGRELFYPGHLHQLSNEQLNSRLAELRALREEFDAMQAAKTAAKPEPVARSVNWEAQDAKVVKIDKPNPQGIGAIHRGGIVPGAGKKNQGRGKGGKK